MFPTDAEYSGTLGATVHAIKTGRYDNAELTSGFGRQAAARPKRFELLTPDS
jgi:hypothetical protein